MVRTDAQVTSARANLKEQALALLRGRRRARWSASARPAGLDRSLTVSYAEIVAGGQQRAVNAYRAVLADPERPVEAAHGRPPPGGRRPCPSFRWTGTPPSRSWRPASRPSVRSRASWRPWWPRSSRHRRRPNRPPSRPAWPGRINCPPDGRSGEAALRARTAGTTRSAGSAGAGQPSRPQPSPATGAGSTGRPARPTRRPAVHRPVRATAAPPSPATRAGAVRPAPHPPATRAAPPATRARTTADPSRARTATPGHHRRPGPHHRRRPHRPPPPPPPPVVNSPAPGRRQGGRLRLRPAGQAVPVGRRRPQLLRLLRPDDDGLGDGRRVLPAPGPGPVRHDHADPAGRCPARRPDLLRDARQRRTTWASTSAAGR